MDAQNPSNNFNIVGVGASAGGLEALELFFSNVPSDSGLAFVVVQHLSPDYKSLMVELLAKRTPLTVHAAQDGVQVEPNAVYLIPPKKDMTIFHGSLHLTDRENEPFLHLPIDIFFNSLAEDQGEKAIGIVLSGTGSDGTRGIRAIKEAGGMVMAQTKESAKFDGMPRSAIATQLVDFILAPQDMPIELLRYIRHPSLNKQAPGPVLPDDEKTLEKIFAVLRSKSGVDFSYYKRNTMVRRIERRMNINQIGSLDDYLRYLQQSSVESSLLYKEMLIGVTRFFRDPEAYELLEEKVIPTMLESKSWADGVRIWVPACSTGEEAYSIAILVSEYMEKTGRKVDVKIFATDIDKDALEFASRGIYPESIAADVPVERLGNFFIKRGDRYEVIRDIREIVIFARQDLTRDPPFSKIDLISCRNVLIYLEPVLQKKVFSVFQFALNPNGFLFLGTSETADMADEYFLSYHNKWKVYQYRGGFRPSMLETSNLNLVDDEASVSRDLVKYVPRGNDHGASEGVYRHLVEAFLPDSIIIDENANLIHAFGKIDQYLRVPTGGRVSLNVLKMIRQNLSVALGTAIHRAVKDNDAVVYHSIQLDNQDENSRTINLQVHPFLEPNTRQQLLFVQFEPVPELLPPPDTKPFDFDSNANQRIRDLEQELQYTKENLQAIIEELETSNEELQATNEELLAANEELQSTNEELQSVNEELITVNAEYQAKIKELTDLNDDVNNLLSSTDIGTVFLDHDLRVRKFTPAAQEQINLLDQDVGRPLGHISHNLKNYDLLKASEQVLQTLTSTRLKVQHTNGNWYLLKILPYRTADNRIDGVIITFVDITDLEETERALRESEGFFQSTLNLLSDHIAIIDSEGEIVTVNDAWREFGEANGYIGSDFGVGVNYLRLCEAAQGEAATGAVQVADGIRAVLQGDVVYFDHEYPCHGPDEDRWFRMRVTRYTGEQTVRGVVIHTLIRQARTT